MTSDFGDKLRFSWIDQICSSGNRRDCITPWS